MQSSCHRCWISDNAYVEYERVDVMVSVFTPTTHQPRGKTLWEACGTVQIENDWGVRTEVTVSITYPPPSNMPWFVKGMVDPVTVNVPEPFFEAFVWLFTRNSPVL